MRRPIIGQFPSFASSAVTPNHVNLVDGTIAGGRTPGTCAVAAIDVGLPVSSLDQITSWAIALQFGIAIPSIPQQPAFGRIGRLYTSVIADGDAIPSTGPNTNNFGNADDFRDIPSMCLSNLQILFDGNVSGSPPASVSGTTADLLAPTEGLIISSFNLAQPIPVEGGSQQVGVGLWLTSSLVSAGLALFIQNARFSLS